ncbi:unnamed protein product [Rotaria socialis]|uniref:Uncharacterized protein n=1 Tax=Rotaria socialis TaxID=392032 RepID=A0A821R5H3_9BILA|nr:unnamed protein product [Rotaria socialis]
MPSVLGLRTKTLIALACIDRFLITNDRAIFRGLSTPMRAKYTILLSIVFWPIFYSHIAMMTTIIAGQLGVFGYLTYRNMRKRYNCVQPILPNVATTNISIRRRDPELLIIVITEICVYIITFSIYLQIELFIRSIALLLSSLLFITFAAPIYIYLVASKTFRRDFKHLIVNFFRKLTKQTVIQIAPRVTNHTLAQVPRF